MKVKFRFMLLDSYGFAAALPLWTFASLYVQIRQRQSKNDFKTKLNRSSVV